MPQSNNPLHGLTLETIVTDLVNTIGWEKMAEKVSINCFMHDPSVKSSLAFLRKTLWARTKVETMYIFNLNKIQKAKETNLP